MNLRREQDGFTYIETIISVALITFMLMAVTAVFVTAITSLSLGRARALGLSLANEQMEYLRDLPYDSLATQNGDIYPPGNIPDTQTITRGKYQFTVKTIIEFVDDPFDGNAAGTIPGKPQDLFPYDYKRAEVQILFGKTNLKIADLSTNISAKAAETATNTGIMSIKVTDANGVALAGVNIHITNPAQNPAVDITTITDNSGLVLVPKLPPDSNSRYKVVASLAGYSTDQTLAPPGGGQVAVQPNLNILVQQITNQTLAIDRLATLTLQIRDTTGAAIPNLAITLKGSKKNYTNPDVFKYSQSLTTDASGNIVVPSLEWDSYTVTVPNGRYIVTSNPTQPFVVAPNSSSTTTLVVSSSSTYPTITSFTPTTDPTNTNPVTVQVTGTNLGAGTTIKLSQAGQPDIVGTGITTSGTSMSANFNLTGAAIGKWDIVVSNAGGTATQTGGFNVSP